LQRAVNRSVSACEPSLAVFADGQLAVLDIGFGKRLRLGQGRIALTQLFSKVPKPGRRRGWIRRPGAHDDAAGDGASGLNKLLIDRWLKNGRYYQLNLVSGGHKNPECRTADDVRIATGAPVEFATGAATAVLSAAMFIVVLWTVGGAFTVHIGETAFSIPGFLVIAAVIYAAVASGTMLVAGRRLIAVSENRDQAKAEYRYVLTRVRENGECLSLLEGDEEECRGFDTSFETAFLAWRNVCIHSMRTTIVSQTSHHANLTHHSLRAQIPGQFDDARRSHTGGICVRHGAIRVQLAS
jgi:ABC transporter transmembrane protein